MIPIQVIFSGTQAEIDAQIAAWQPHGQFAGEPEKGDFSRPRKNFVSEFPKITCENCGKNPRGPNAIMEDGEFFCNYECEKEYSQKPAKAPRLDAKEDPDKYMPFGRSVSQQSHMKSCAYCGVSFDLNMEHPRGLVPFCSVQCEEDFSKITIPDVRGLIEGYMSHQFTPRAILEHLASEHSIEISHQKLGGYMGAIKKKNLEIARDTMKECSEIYLEKPLGSHQSPKEAKSPKKPMIPSSPLSEADLIMLDMHEAGDFDFEIKQVLDRSGYPMQVGVIRARIKELTA